MRLEVLQGVHVERERFRVVSGIVFLHGLLHVLYRLLLEIAIHLLPVTTDGMYDNRNFRLASAEKGRTLELHRDRTL